MISRQRKKGLKFLSIKVMVHLKLKIRTMKARVNDMQKHILELESIEGTEKVQKLLAEAVEELELVIGSYEEEYEDKGS